MYNAFNAGDYALVKKIKQEVDSKYAGNAIQAQFDYLYALAVAKTENVEKFMELLKQIRVCQNLDLVRHIGFEFDVWHQTLNVFANHTYQIG